MGVVVAAVVIAALPAGCDDSAQKYSRGDIDRAFRSQGLELQEPNRGEDSLLIAIDRASDAPRAETGEPIGVVIYANEKDATDALRTRRSQASSESFELRKGNVVVTSDGGVNARMRKRLRDALAQLGCIPSDPLPQCTPRLLVDA